MCGPGAPPSRFSALNALPVQSGSQRPTHLRRHRRKQRLEMILHVHARAGSRRRPEKAAARVRKHYRKDSRSTLYDCEVPD
jgi:hypothetical protein